ncbi:MAG TPA: serine hydrolase domain-containing protein [Acidimicrobiales bacterium]|nr:serine hydrolase domain-containing protein [Acidimicrobiales bacterium]
MQTDPRAAGMDAERLERITEHLQARYVDPGKIAGCQATVWRDGSLAYSRSLGSSDLERGTPVRDDTVWRIYSMTKPITSVALMTLYERGLFQLSDPVHRFLPEWRDLRVAQVGANGDTTLVEPERPMSVRDLLMHMSGLTYGGDPSHPVDRRYGEAGVADRSVTLDTFVKKLADIPLKFSPGTRWHYSYSTDVCGRLVEVLSGCPLDEFLATEIFAPLGMHDTAFHIRDDQVDRFAANYMRGPDKSLRLIDDPRASAYQHAPAFLSGGGGLVSTTADYLRFCRMLLAGGELDGARVLGSRTIDLMTDNHLPGGGDLARFALGAFGETGFEGIGFGLGFAVGLGPVASQSIGSAGEYYWGGAASTIFWIDPVEDLIVIFMTQLMPSATFNFRGQLKALVYPAIVD